MNESKVRFSTAGNGCSERDCSGRGAAVGAFLVSWPPKFLAFVDCEFWIAICRWYASSALPIGCALDVGSGSAFGSLPLPTPRVSRPPRRCGW